MASKKSTKNMKNTVSDESNSENEKEVVVSKTTKSKPTNKKMAVSLSKNESDSDSESENEEDVVGKTKNKQNNSKMVKVETIDDDSEEISSDSDSESEDDQDKKSTKEKKPKESFDELTKRLDILQTNIKTIDKDILEAQKELKTKEKTRNDYERQRNSILKILSKTHNDELVKARKEKPKRKGNVNGGFNKDQPVPEILVKFLELEKGASMPRPQVMSALNNKFSQLGLKKGQETILDKTTVKALELDKSYEDKHIKFGEFQTFLKGFYTSKEVNSVVMS